MLHIWPWLCMRKYHKWVSTVCVCVVLSLSSNSSLQSQAWRVVLLTWRAVALLTCEELSLYKFKIKIFAWDAQV